jgi:hypothetical protein
MVRPRGLRADQGNAKGGRSKRGAVWKVITVTRQAESSPSTGPATMGEASPKGDEVTTGDDIFSPPTRGDTQNTFFEGAVHAPVGSGAENVVTSRHLVTQGDSQREVESTASKELGSPLVAGDDELVMNWD